MVDVGRRQKPEPQVVQPQFREIFRLCPFLRPFWDNQRFGVATEIRLVEQTGEVPAERVQTAQGRVGEFAGGIF